VPCEVMDGKWHAGYAGRIFMRDDACDGAPSGLAKQRGTRMVSDGRVGKSSVMSSSTNGAAILKDDLGFWV